jgi:hypothetical protein
MGAITIELGGHLHNVIDDAGGYFEHAMAVTGALLGMPGQAGSRRRRTRPGTTAARQTSERP